MPIEHFMMFGTFAEQRHFVYPSEDVYTGVIFNANMVAHAPGGLAGFLVTRTNTLPYIIDPLTHAFQHAPNVVLKDDGQVLKRAFDILATKYGGIIREKAGVGSVLPTDFQNLATKSALVSSVFEFERREISEKAAAHDDCKYFDEGELSNFAPRALVPPYFFMREYQRDQWLELNIDLTKIGVLQKKPGEKIYAEIVLEKGSLYDHQWLKFLATKYEETSADGYLIWIDDFDEHQATLAELSGFLNLCRDLRKSGKDLINLHGGYFSILAAGSLGQAALTGVTHGPEFGESRAVVPVGGGLPFAKFYLPLLHNRVKYKDMLAILRFKGWDVSAKVFRENVCSCQACEDVINGNFDNFSLYGESTPIERRNKGGIVRIDFPTQEARLLCLKHYLQCKRAEYKFGEEDPSLIIRQLERGIKELEDVLGIEGVKHLINWKIVLEENRI